MHDLFPLALPGALPIESMPKSWNGPKSLSWISGQGSPRQRRCDLFRSRCAFILSLLHASLERETELASEMQNTKSGSD